MQEEGQLPRKTGFDAGLFKAGAKTGSGSRGFCLKGNFLLPSFQTQLPFVDLSI